MKKFITIGDGCISIDRDFIAELPRDAYGTLVTLAQLCDRGFEITGVQCENNNLSSLSLFFLNEHGYIDIMTDSFGRRSIKLLCAEFC